MLRSSNYKSKIMELWGMRAGGSLFIIVLER